MARRQIEARRTSPYQLYLLIGFVVLTIVFAVLFIWIVNLYNADKQNVFGEGYLEEAKQQGIDPWARLVQDYPQLGTTTVRDLLAAQKREGVEYQGEIHRMLQTLVGDPYSGQSGDDLRRTVSANLGRTTELLAQVNDTLKKSYQLVGGEGADVHPDTAHAAFDALMKRIVAMMGHVQQDNASIAQLQADLNTRGEERDAAKAEFARQVSQQLANFQAEKDRLEVARKDAIATSQALQDKLRQISDKIIEILHAKNVDNEKSRLEINRLQNELGQLAGEVKEIKKPPTETGVDGTVIRVSDFSSVAYSDLGKKDGVLLGLTFSVFSQAQLGLPDAEPKAEARIVRIMEDSSELRLYGVKRSVVVGDVLINPIYDRSRRLSFRLVGKIDIDGDGVDDSERLKGIIQQFGGRVDDNLTVKTDFLVTGEEPQVLAPPAQDAPQSERDRYDRYRREFLQYSEELVKAQNYGIPILSLNRFLGLVGIAGRA